MKRLCIVLGLAMMTASVAMSVASLVVAAVFGEPLLPSPCATASPQSPHQGTAGIVLALPTATPACFRTPRSPRHSLIGYGPLQVSALGGMDIGVHRTKTSTVSSSQNQLAVSMLLSASRRTEQTSLTLEDAVGSVNNATTVGQLVLGYSTPKYSLAYGPVVGPSDTQLAIGAFNRGVTLTLPRRNGELDLIAASSTATNGEGFRSLGIRRLLHLRRGALLSSTLINSTGDQGGRNTVFDLAYVRYRAGASYRGELAYAVANGIPKVDDGARLAAALHADFSNFRSFTSINLTLVPDGFTTLGSAQFRQTTAELSYRRDLGRLGAINLDVQDNRTGSSVQPVHTTQENLSYSEPLKFGSAVAVFGATRSETAGTVTQTQTRGLALSETFNRFNLNQTLQSATSSSGGGLATQSLFGFTVGHPIGRAYLLAGEDFGRSQTTGSATIQNRLHFGLNLPLGYKTVVGISSESQTTNTSNQLIRQQTIAFDVQRRVSNVFTLHLTAGRAMQQGIGGGSGSFLNVDLTGPLGVGGNARYTGRPNPNLPAVVRGHVYFQDSPLDYGLVGQRGIPNALIVLDNGISERTDASGSFEFRFVATGHHTLTVEPGTLPTGLIPDEGSHVFDVRGGQIATFDFSAGAFAGLSGRIMSGDEGVPGVTIAVDGVARTVTDATGGYQIGRLLPGAHTVGVVTESLPANVQLDGAPNRQVSIAQGALSQVNFKTVGLGAMKGTVLYTASMGMGDLVGAKDVYVVASPGDHAAITDPDGTFLIDNLPLGTYTLAIDPQTIPEDQVVIESPEGPFIVTGGEPVSGLVFKIGPKAKEVVFTFSGGKHADVATTLSPDRAPPGALVNISVTTSERKARNVVASGDLLGKILLHRTSEGHYGGSFVVPPLPAGDVPLRITVDGPTKGTSEAALSVDPSLPLVSVRMNPSHPRAGSVVHVFARILADVREGQKIVFRDGYTVSLPAGRGRIFSFDVRIWNRGLPYPGTIATSHGPVSFVLEGM